MRVSIPIVALGAAVALVPTWVWAQGPSETDRYAYGPHMMWWGGGWYGMIFGPLIMILVLAGVIAAVVLFVRWAGGPWPGTAASHHAPQDRTLVNSEMSPRRVVICGVCLQDLPKMCLTPDDHMVEAFTADRPDRTFYVSILPAAIRRP